jgi:hypothetical protein
MLRRFPLKLRLTIAVASIIGYGAAAPVTSIASCVPPPLRPFPDEPGAIVVAGTVRETNPQQVALDVQLWWGADPQPSVAIQRPATDPTVISSTDWDPKPGEQWVVLARRDGNVLRTSVCDQMPATAVSVGEVESSLGPGVVPAAADPTSGGATPDPGLPGWVPFLGGGLLAALAVVAVVALNRRRRASGGVDPR